jgi:hypothetical protein
MRGKTLQSRSTFPRFGSLVIGKDGRVKARFVDPDFRHRMGDRGYFRRAGNRLNERIEAAGPNHTPQPAQ